MPNHRRSRLFALIVTTAWVGWAPIALGEFDLAADQIKSEIYFGSDMGVGHTVSDQAWETFLSEVIRPQLPNGFTVIDALGKGAHPDGPLTRTRVLIVVHPGNVDAEALLNSMRVEYERRFWPAAVFRIEQPVRVRP
jgi:hypothetical protein